MRALPIAVIALLSAGCQPSVEERAANSKALIDRYCTDCHNDAERTGELTLEGLALTDVGAHAAVWESVVRKLRGRMMPPACSSRPWPIWIGYDRGPSATSTVAGGLPGERLLAVIASEVVLWPLS